MKVSILTSVYNKEAWLERWFASVRGQTFKDLEIVVVDNASTDGSSEIIRRNADEDPRVKVVTLSPNRGPAGGFQAAIDHASGEFLTFMDADDYADENYIAALYHAIADNRADLSMCLNNVVYEDGGSWHKDWPSSGLHVVEGDRTRLLPCQLLDELSDKYFGFHMPELGATWIKMCRSSIIKKFSISWNKSLFAWSDFDFWLRYIWHVGKMAYTTETVYHFFQSQDSTTRPKGYNPGFVPHVVDAMESIFGQVREHVTPRLLNAASRFAFNRYAECLTYLWRNKKEAGQKNLHEEYGLLVSSAPVKFLFSMKSTPLLSLRERLFLRLTKDRHVALAFRLSAADLKARQMGGYVIHMRFLDHK